MGIHACSSLKRQPPKVARILLATEYMFSREQEENLVEDELPHSLPQSIQEEITNQLTEQERNSI